MKNIIFILFFYLLFLSCEQREWRNPYDPSGEFKVVSDLTVEQIASNSIKLNWKDNSDIEDGFIIQRKIEDGEYKIIGTVDANITSYYDQNLSKETVYFYRVKAYFKDKNSINSGEIEVAIPNPPSDFNLSFTVKDDIVYLTQTWKDHSKLEENFIIMQEITGKGTSDFATVSRNDTILQTRLDKLNSENVYSFWVVAKSKNIISEPSTAITITYQGLQPVWSKQVGSTVYDLDFSPNTKYLAIAAGFQMYQVSDGGFIWKGTNIISPYRVKFNHDGSKIAIGGYLGLELLDSNINKTIWSRQEHSDYISTIKFSKDDSRILTGSDDHTINLWDSESGLVLWTGYHENRVNSVCFNQVGDKIASISTDKVLKLWNAENGDLLWQGHHSGSIKSVFFTSDDSKVVTCSSDSTIKVWDTESGTIHKSISFPYPIFSLNIHPSKDILIVGGKYEILILDLHTETQIWSYTDNHIYQWQDVCFSPDGSKVLSHCGNYIKVWYADTGELISEWTEPWYGLFVVKFSKNSMFIASGGKDHIDDNLKVWSTIPILWKIVE